MLTKAQAKYIQNLGHKKLREDENLFIAEGPKLVLELLQESSVALHSIYAIESFATSHTHIKDIIEISQDELNRISFLTTPNQVIALFNKPRYPKVASMRGRVSLMLDTIQDPGNLGSIVRTADWFGINTIICSKDTADIFNPKVVQATMGSIARVQMMYEQLDTFMQENDLPPLYVTALKGKSIQEIGPLTEGIILIGNESKGVSEELLNHPHTLVTIPKKGKAESLNAAIATGIVLSHLAR
jgi:TrmH family RNA methyltransferase